MTEIPEIFEGDVRFNWALQRRRLSIEASIREHWKAGRDTAVISERMGLPESTVANTLVRIRDRRFR